MNHLIKLNLDYLFSMKIIMISFVIIGFSMIGFLLFSNFYVSEQVLYYNRDEYFRDYLFDGINFMKIIGIFYALFLVINGYVLNKYDVFLVCRVSRKRSITTKLFVLLFGNGIFLLFCYLIFLIIPLYLTPYVNTSENFIKIFVEILIFSSYYLILFVLVYQITKNMYAMLVVIIGYFITNLSSDYYINKSAVNGFCQMINTIFIDIGYYQVVKFDFYYGVIHSVVLISISCIIYITLAQKADIII